MSQTRRHLLILTVLVFLLRLPFLNQAVGGDDPYYLAAAYHALIDPLHPNHTWYVFEGKDVNFQGYPHPPGNAWFLAGLLSLFKDVREGPFHAAYIAFSLMAAYSVYALARRFSARPFWATALFMVVPAFCVNGNTFESDVPLVAFWTAGAAAFIYGVNRDRTFLLAIAAGFLAVSALIAMQSLLFVPILLSYLWFQRARWSFGRVLAASTPLVTLGLWQVFERITSGVFPAAISTGYLVSYGFERFGMKLRNAAGLSIHSLFLVCPLLLPFIALAVWRKRTNRDIQFLLCWIGLFLGGAWVLFYSGSARYLLPLAAPVALLATLAPIAWVRAAFVFQLVLSLALATVNYQHWNAYRSFAQSLTAQSGRKRIWVDADWGLRHYLEASGALPLHENQWIPTGDVVVESELGYPIPILHGGRSLVPIAQTEICPRLPFRLIGLEARSGYSTVAQGFLPFDSRGGAIDRVRAYVLEAREPELSFLPMAAPEAESQIVSGVYSLEPGGWRWMSGRAVILLRSPRRMANLELKLYLAPGAPAREVTLSVAGGPEKRIAVDRPGSYSVSLEVDAAHLAHSVVTVQIAVDHTFSPPGDNRKLGIILNSVGFLP